MKLDDLDVYQLAMELGESVWDIVKCWGGFATSTIGRQWVRAVDSIAANISEGFGRYYYKQNKQFCYSARGSLYETGTWLQLRKAVQRKLISQEEYDELENRLETLGKRLNTYIRSIGNDPHTSDK